MKKMYSLLLVFLLMMVLAGNLSATTMNITNSGFESGTANWTATTPTGGNGVFGTYNSSHDWDTTSNDLTLTPTESTLYAGLTESIFIEQTISWTAGSEIGLDFSWAFINADYVASDTASVQIINPTDNTEVWFTHLLMTNVPPPPAIPNATEWATYQLRDDLFSTESSAILRFSMLGNSASQSVLLLDGITGVPSQTQNPSIPEPATMVLFGLGLLGFAGVSRKKV